MAQLQSRPLFPDYNFASHFYNFRGQKIHYLDEGKGDAIILLHGNPTWSFLYRKMIPLLSKKYRVIAPDLLGFGLSSKPLDKSHYMFQNHLLVITSLFESLALKNVIVVGQDWGGPLISTYAIKHKTIIKGVVLMNTFLPGMKLNIPWYFSLLFRSFYSEYLIKNFDLFRKVSFTFGFAKHISKDVKNAYFFAQNKDVLRVPITVFAQSIPTAPSDPTYKFLQEISDELQQWPVKKLIMFSDKDPLFKQNAAEKLSKKLPNSKFIKIENAGHFLQEEQGEYLAQNILNYFD